MSFRRHRLLRLALALWAATTALSRTMTAVARGTQARPRPRFTPRMSVVGVGVVCAVVGGMSGLPASFAVLTDSASTSTVSMSGGSMEAPTGLALADPSGTVNASWTAPASGIAPDSYRVYRSTTSGSYGPALASPAGTSYGDSTVTACSTYYYEVRSAYQNLIGAPSSEQSIVADATAPTVTAADAVGTSGPSDVLDYVKSAGAAQLYATVTDNCDAASALTVTFTIVGQGTYTATSAGGPWTPVPGGPTYDFRVTGVTMPTAVDGTSYTVRVAATDSHGNAAAAFTGHAITVDATGPVVDDAVLVPTSTNDFDAEPGEIDTTAGTADTYYVYANVSDAASGAGAQQTEIVTTADTSNVSGASSTTLPLAWGTYGTDEGTSWPLRSAATAPLASFTKLTFTITAEDPLGNVTTSSNFRLTKDNAGPTLNSCKGANGGTSSRLDANDTLTLKFNEVITPNSIMPTWTNSSVDSPLFTATVDDGGGSNDFMTFGSPVSFLTTAALGLGAKTWTTGTLSGSSFALSAKTLTLTFGSASTTITRPTTSGTINLDRTTGLTDVAGNPVTTASLACTDSW